MIKRSEFLRVLLIGLGEVAVKRYLPALELLNSEGVLSEICVCDTSPDAQKAIGDSSIRFLLLKPDWSAEDLVLAGALDCNTKAIVATPTRFHVPHAIRLANHANSVAIEKPLSLSTCEATAIEVVADKIFPIDHQLYKSDMLQLVESNRSGQVLWSDVVSIQMELCETIGIGQRQIDDAVFDLVYHLLACAQVLGQTAEQHADISIQRCRLATYCGGPDLPSKATAAQVSGTLRRLEQTIPFVAVAGKGLGAESKRVRLIGQNDVVLAEACLTESGHLAHARALGDFLLGHESQLSVRDSICIVEACEHALDISMENPAYDFGTTPSWLRDGSSLELALHANTTLLEMQAHSETPAMPNFVTTKDVLADKCL